MNSKYNYHPKKSRALKTIAPIVRLESLRSEDGLNYDFHSIAIEILTIVIDNMTLTNGIRKEDVVKKLIPMLRAAEKRKDSSFPDEYYAGIITKIIDRLLNRGERGSFNEEYVDYSCDTPASRVHSFKLLTEILEGETIILHAETAAINIFLQMLDIDLESQQDAMLLMIKQQMEDGHFDQAIEAAQANKYISISRRERIRNYVQQTKRDIELSDWNQEIPAELEKGLEHVKNCLYEETKRKEHAENELHSISGQETDRRDVKKLSELYAVLQETINMHMSLVREIMEARDVFKAEQLRQVFRPKSRRGGLDLEQEVFDPLLQQDRNGYEKTLSFALPIVEGLHIPKLIGFDKLLGHLLVSRKPRPLFRDIVDMPLEKRCYESLVYYHPEKIKVAGELIIQELERFTGGISLSQLLSHAISLDLDQVVIDFIVIIVIGKFALGSYYDGIFPEGTTVTQMQTKFDLNTHAGQDFLINTPRGG